MTDIVRDFIAAELAKIERTVDTDENAEIGYGSDLSCVLDITSDLTETDPLSSDNLVERCGRRLITEPGSLWGVPDYGFNLIARLNRGTTAAERGLIEVGIEQECLKEDGVSRAEATVVIEGTSQTAYINLIPDDPEANPLPFAFRITAGTNIVELLT